MAALVSGVALGALLAGAQSWLPLAFKEYANSGGPWVLASFLVALAARDGGRAIASGFVCMVGLVIGFFLASTLHSLPPSGNPALWASAAIVFGPLAGLAAGWVRFGRPPLAATAAGGIGGVIVGEAIAQVHNMPYWPIEAIVGLGLIMGLLSWQGRRLAPQRILAGFRVSAVALVACLAAVAITVGAAHYTGFS